MAAQAQFGQEPDAPRKPVRRGVLHYVLRVIAWSAGSLVTIVILCGCAFLALIYTGAGNRYLLALVDRKAAEALGVRVKIESFALHPTTLSVDLYGIRISGAPPHPEPPLLQVDHLKAGVRVVSVIRRAWYLDEVQIDHPVAWVSVDKTGASNIPTFKSNSSSHTSLFDLGIRHVQLVRGEVYYNSRPESISANLNGLEFHSVYGPQKRYSGALSYSRGDLSIGGFRPLQHSLEIDFAAAPDVFTVKQLNVTAGASRVLASATLENYSRPTVKAQYQVVLDGAQAARILGQANVPSGSVQASGSVQYQQTADRSLIQSLVANGEVASTELVWNSRDANARIANLSGHYSLANGNASVQDLRANVFGGQLSAEGTMKAIGGDTHASFRVDLEKVSLAGLQRALGNSASEVSLDGWTSATATATWGKTIRDLTAKVDLTLNGSAAGTRLRSAGTAGANANPAAIPFQGAIHCVYLNADRSLTLNRSDLKSSQANLSLNGTISRDSSLAVDFEINDLHEISTFIDAFRKPEQGTGKIDLAGSAAFQGTVRGSISSPQVRGQLTAGNLEYNGAKFRLLHTAVTLSPDGAGVQNLRLEAAQRGQMTGSASIGLHDWSITRQGELQADLNASGLPTAMISELSGRSIPVEGTLSLNAHLHGKAIAPVGNANVALKNATAFGQTVSQATIELTGSASQVKVFAGITSPAGVVEVRGTTDAEARTFSAELSSSGIDLTKIQAISRKEAGNLKGVLKLQLHGQGSYNDPTIDANLDCPGLAIGGQALSNTRLQASLAHHVANVDLVSTVVDAPLHGKAQLHLEGDDLIDATLDTPVISLDPILAAYAPGNTAGVTGEAEIHASVHGPLKFKDRLQAGLTVPVLKIAYNQKIQLAASPIQANFQNGVVRLQPVTIRGTDTELRLQGSFPVGGEAPANLQAHGEVNLQMAQIFDPDLQASGQLRLNIDSSGTTASSLMAGEIDLTNVGVSTTAAPVGLQNCNGVLKLSSDRLVVSRFSGELGGGQISAQGAVVYRPSVRLDLGVAVQGARVLYPQGVRETINSNLRLTGSMTQAVLGGTVNLANLSLTPGFDLTSMVNQLSGGVQTPSTPGFEQNLKLNIALSSSGNANLVSRTLSVDGNANLQIRGTAAQPVILGRVNLNSGDVILNGNRFVLTGGTIQFINPAMTEAELNVTLTTTIREYKINLLFQGPADQMRTQYSSNPSLPQADIVNLLAFGQTTEASAMNATPMNQQAEGLVASQVASQVTSRISKAAGISQLSISPVLQSGTAAGPAGANLTIQQRVTGNLFVTFSTNVASTQGQTIQGQYQVSPHVTVSATRDPNGGFALDALIKRSF